MQGRLLTQRAALAVPKRKEAEEQVHFGDAGRCDKDYSHLAGASPGAWEEAGVKHPGDVQGKRFSCCHRLLRGLGWQPGGSLPCLGVILPRVVLKALNSDSVPWDRDRVGAALCSRGSRCLRGCPVPLSLWRE